MKNCNPCNRRKLATGVAIAAIALSFPLAAVAQGEPSDLEEAEEAGEPVTLPPMSAWALPALPVKKFGAEIRTVSSNDGACRHAPLGGYSAADPMGCPFDDTKFGIAVDWRGDAPVGEFELRAAVARRSEDGFGLDRQFFPRVSGTSLQSTLTQVAASAALLDDRITLSSEFGWNRRWRTPVASSTLFPERFERTGGDAQSHRIEVKLANEKKFAVSLDASYSRADGYYLPFMIDKPSTFYVLPGEELRLGGKANIGEIGLRSRYSSQRGDYFDRDTLQAWLSYSGVTLRAKLVDAQSKPFVFEGFDQALVADNSIGTTNWSLGVDVTPSQLFPLAAADIDGWGALLPQSLSLSIGRRERTKESAGLLEQTGGATFSASGVWLTPIGHTVLTFDRQSLRGILIGDPDLESRESSLFIDHSFSLGKWSLGANLLRTASQDGNPLLAGSGTAVTYYGLSASRRFKDGPEFRIDFGRDAMAFDVGQGDFRLRDRTTRLEVSLDMSNMLRHRLGHQDVHFKLEGRLDLGGSGYEIRFLGDLLDSEYESLRATGALMTFGLSF